MSETSIWGICQWCSGTGTDSENIDENGNVIPVPCAKCGATGRIASTVTMDTTEIVDRLDKCLKRLKKIMDELKLDD